MNTHKKPVKTYISEANQNRISDTLSVEDVEQQAAGVKLVDVCVQSSDELGTINQNDISTQEPSQPEALSAPFSPLPPTSAAADAEAVAGYTIGATYGDEGQIKAEEKILSRDSKE